VCVCVFVCGGECVFVHVCLCIYIYIYMVKFFYHLKGNDVTCFSEECNEFLQNRYLILDVTVPLQLLVTAILNVTSYFKK
jgi:hypothetical protein